MGADDDVDCAAHEWVITEVHPTVGHTGIGYACTRCGAPRYDDLTPPATRPKL